MSGPAQAVKVRSPSASPLGASTRFCYDFSHLYLQLLTSATTGRQRSATRHNNRYDTWATCWSIYHSHKRTADTPTSASICNTRSVMEITYIVHSGLILYHKLTSTLCMSFSSYRFTARRYASVVYAMIMCPSVCPSQTGFQFSQWLNGISCFWIQAEVTLYLSYITL